jgi:cytochrome P450
VIDLLSPDARRNPYPGYAQLRAAAPVLRDPRSGTWLLLDYESVKRALTDHATFASDVSAAGRGNLGWLIFTDPPRHTKLRALVMRAFTPRAVAALEPRIREIARGLLDRTVGRGQMELVSEFSVPLPLMVIAEMLGAPTADWPRLRHWSDAIMGLAHTVAAGPDAERAVAAFRAAHEEMTAYLAPLLAERRARPADDLLTRLTAAEVDGEWLTDHEILVFFELLLLAGHETTTNLIDNAVLCFHEHPDQLARLRAAPQLLPSAIEEVLRYRSPVQATFRVAARDVELHGQTIPARSLVLAMIGSANRDPRHFADAERFDVAREPNLHLAFGHGIHFCVGAPLARLEARVALPMLLDHLGDYAPAGEGAWEPRAAFHVHGPSRLPLRFTPTRRAAGAA